MTPIELCKRYLALKLHFTKENYNYFDKGMVPIKQETFNKRSDRHFFEKVSKHIDPVGLLVANYIENGKFPWIGQLDDKLYFEWLKKVESITYNLNTDLTNIENSLIIYVKVKDGQHSPMIKDVIADRIRLETFCIILDVCELFEYYDAKLAGDPLWKKLKILYLKYFPFIRHRYDRKKISEIVEKRLKVDINRTHEDIMQKKNKIE